MNQELHLVKAQIHTITHMTDDDFFQPTQLRKLAEYVEDLQRYRIPFGRYGPENFPPEGKLIYELPHEYLIWFRDGDDGFPRGRLGELMQFVCEVKTAGAEEIFATLRKK